MFFCGKISCISYWCVSLTSELRYCCQQYIRNYFTIAGHKYILVANVKLVVIPIRPWDIRTRVREGSCPAISTSHMPTHLAQWT